MPYWSFMCLAVGTLLNDEAAGWICLLLAVLPWFFKFALAYARLLDRENRKIAPAIDEDGFYI